MHPAHMEWLADEDAPDRARMAAANAARAAAAAALDAHHAEHPEDDYAVDPCPEEDRLVGALQAADDACIAARAGVAVDGPEMTAFRRYADAEFIRGFSEACEAAGSHACIDPVALL